MTLQVFRRAFAALLALPLIMMAQPAKAGGALDVALFYTAINVSQAKALQASADYYEAIGMSAQAQNFNRLAADMRSGSLGGADGVKTFVRCSEAVGRDIQELEAAGVYPTARQVELAKKARGELNVAKVALVASVALGTKAVLDSEGNVFAKVALGVLIAAEASRVLSAIRQVNQVADGYRAFQLGAATGFQVASREVQPQFADL